MPPPHDTPGRDGTAGAPALRAGASGEVVAAPLAAKRWGGCCGTVPAVLVHGFTQGLWAWGSIGSSLGTNREVTAADLPGHGGSSATRAGPWTTAALLAGVARGPAAWVGYSLGGRMCLHLALERPDLVKGLVLVGAHPGIADEAEREARRRADAELADSLDPPPGHPSASLEPRHRLDRFLDRWLANPLFAGLDARSAELDRRRENDPAGLAWSLRLAGTGSQEPLWERLGELRMPVLVVAGEGDRKFSAIGRQTADAIGPRARFEAIRGAGHAVHLEQPGRFGALLGEWLGALDRA